MNTCRYFFCIHYNLIQTDEDFFRGEVNVIIFLNYDSFVLIYKQSLESMILIVVIMANKKKILKEKNVKKMKVEGNSTMKNGGNVYFSIFHYLNIYETRIWENERKTECVLFISMSTLNDHIFYILKKYQDYWFCKSLSKIATKKPSVRSISGFAYKHFFPICLNFGLPKFFHFSANSNGFTNFQSVSVSNSKTRWMTWRVMFLWKISNDGFENLKNSNKYKLPAHFLLEIGLENKFKMSIFSH